MSSILAALDGLSLVAAVAFLAPLLVYVTRAHPLLLDSCMRRFPIVFAVLYGTNG